MRASDIILGFGIIFGLVTLLIALPEYLSGIYVQLFVLILILVAALNLALR